VLDEIARIKGADALLCEVANFRISDRLMTRWGWTPHQVHRLRHHEDVVAVVQDEVSRTRAGKRRHSPIQSQRAPSGSIVGVRTQVGAAGHAEAAQ